MTLPIQRDRVTTLIAPLGLDLATLTCAIAISVKLGIEVVSGWVPERPAEVSVIAYEGSWCFWKSLICDVCAVVGVAVPMLDFRFPGAPLVEDVERGPSGPNRDAYWGPYSSADKAAARAAGRNPDDPLFIVVGRDRAIGWGGDGSMAALYRYFSGISTLLVGGKTGFDEGNQLSGEPWAGNFGPVLRVEDLRDQASGVRDLLSQVAAFHLAEERLARQRSRQRRRHPDTRQTRGDRTRSIAPDRAARANTFFAVEPPESLHAILENGRSPAAQLIKAKAKAQGITPGLLWHAAKRLEAALAAETTDDGPLVLQGYAARFDEWEEINRWPDGNYMECLRKGCFRKSIAESASRMRVNFQHARSHQFGDTALGPTEELKLLEDDFGLRYALPIFDTEENRRLAKIINAGLYGSSVSIRVVAEKFVVRPGRSGHNPKGLPERIVLEARLPDFGPVASPLYRTTTAEISYSSGRRSAEGA
jgi:phage head maturation protease